MDSPTTPATDEQASEATPATVPTPAAADELLIEEISIDGMCGVY